VTCYCPECAVAGIAAAALRAQVAKLEGELRTLKAEADAAIKREMDHSQRLEADAGWAKAAHLATADKLVQVEGELIDAKNGIERMHAQLAEARAALEAMRGEAARRGSVGLPKVPRGPFMPPAIANPGGPGDSVTRADELQALIDQATGDLGWRQYELDVVTAERDRLRAAIAPTFANADRYAQAMVKTNMSPGDAALAALAEINNAINAARAESPQAQRPEAARAPIPERHRCGLVIDFNNTCRLERGHNGDCQRPAPAIGQTALTLEEAAAREHPPSRPTAEGEE